MANVKYEYEVVIGDNLFNLERNNRQEARETMKQWKESGFDAKIIQRKYSLQSEQQVR
jgi:hypothetical protein